MTRSTGKRRMWTEEDTATARKLYAELQSYKGVAIAMNRAPSTVQEWLQGLRGKQKVRRKDIEAIPVVPLERLEHRERRLSTPPRDLTAILMGDPRPGYSALDCR